MTPEKAAKQYSELLRTDDEPLLYSNEEIVDFAKADFLAGVKWTKENL